MKNYNKKYFNRNEILQGPSPRVINTLRNYPAQNINRYLDDYEKSELLPILSKKFQIDEENIILSYGSEDLLRFIFNGLHKDSVVLTHEYHFTFYKKYLYFIGIDLKTFEMYKDENSYFFDIDDCLLKIKETNPSLLIITSPNNPTGNKISFEDLEKILNNLEKETLFILDEAYFGYTVSVNESYSELISKYPNLIIMRTFSKFYALAGLRIAYSFCGSSVKSKIMYRAHYLGMSRVLEEVAIAALQSEEYYTYLANEIVSERDRMITEINKKRFLRAYRSDSNFIFVEVCDEDISPKLELMLISEDVIIAKFVYKNFLRVTVGLREYNKLFLQMINKL